MQQRADNFPITAAVSCVPGSWSPRGYTEKTRGSVPRQLLSRRIYYFCLNTNPAGHMVAPADPLMCVIPSKKTTTKHTHENPQSLVENLCYNATPRMELAFQKQRNDVFSF